MSYTAKNWNDGDVISKEGLNHIESGIETLDKSIGTGFDSQNTVAKQLNDKLNRSEYKEYDDKDLKDKIAQLTGEINTEKTERKQADDALKNIIGDIFSEGETVAQVVGELGTSITKNSNSIAGINSTIGKPNDESDENKETIFGRVDQLDIRAAQIEGAINGYGSGNTIQSAIEEAKAGAFNVEVLEKIPTDIKPKTIYLIPNGKKYDKYISYKDGETDKLSKFEGGSVEIIESAVVDSPDANVDYFLKDGNKYTYYKYFDKVGMVAVGVDSYTKVETDELIEEINKNVSQKLNNKYSPSQSDLALIINQNGEVVPGEANDSNAFHDIVSSNDDIYFVRNNENKVSLPVKKYVITSEEYEGGKKYYLSEEVKKDNSPSYLKIEGSEAIVVPEGTGSGGGNIATLILRKKDISPLTIVNQSDAKFKVECQSYKNDVEGKEKEFVEGKYTIECNSEYISSGPLWDGEKEIDLTEFMSNQSVGDYTFKITATNEGGASNFTTFTITYAELKIESSFYDGDTIESGSDAIVRYIPYGAISKNIYFELNGESLFNDPITTSDSGSSKNITIPAKEDGSYLLHCYMKAIINGKTYLSNHVYKDIMWYTTKGENKNTKPIIGCSSRGRIIELNQYDKYEISYNIFDNLTSMPNVKLTTILNSDNESLKKESYVEQKVSNSHNTWVFDASEIGNHTLIIEARDGVKATINIKVNALELGDIGQTSIDPVFDFNPNGKSNNSDNDKNLNGMLSTSDNFDWNNGGYKVDDEGSQYFLVKAGTWAEFDYKMFAGNSSSNISKTGLQFKIIFEIENVSNIKTQWLDCSSENENEINLKMYAHEGYLNTSKSTSLYMPYSEDDIIELEFNINNIDRENNKLENYIMAYEDGTPLKSIIYNTNTQVYQINAKPIKIGSEDCDVRIYRMRGYNASLTPSEILANFIMDGRNSKEITNRYSRNQINDSNGLLSPDILKNKCPNLRIIRIEAPLFTNDKKDFQPNTTVYCDYVNGRDEDNWKAENCFHSGQGTTSNAYGAAGRNLDFFFYDGSGKPPFKGVEVSGKPATKITFTKTKETKEGEDAFVTLSDSSVPNNWFNIKLNIASSENANNALLQKIYNDCMEELYTTPAQERQNKIENNKIKIKNDMEFYNCVVFIKETNKTNSTHREFKDQQWHFYGIGNIGDSKKTDSTRSYDPDDMNEFTVEISDNTLSNAAFQTGVIYEFWYYNGSNWTQKNLKEFNKLIEDNPEIEKSEGNSKPDNPSVEMIYKLRVIEEEPKSSMSYAYPITKEEWNNPKNIRRKLLERDDLSGHSPKDKKATLENGMLSVLLNPFTENCTANGEPYDGAYYEINGEESSDIGIKLLINSGSYVYGYKIKSNIVNNPDPEEIYYKREEVDYNGSKTYKYNLANVYEETHDTERIEDKKYYKLDENSNFVEFAGQINSTEKIYEIYPSYNTYYKILKDLIEVPDSTMLGKKETSDDYGSIYIEDNGSYVPYVKAKDSFNDNLKQYCYISSSEISTDSFELRYGCGGDLKDGKQIDNKNDKTTNSNQIKKNADVFKAFYEWVVTCSNEDFVNQLPQWCVKNSVLFFYLFTLTFTMIDNRAKNTFWHFAKTSSQIGDNGYTKILAPDDRCVHLYSIKNSNGEYVPAGDTKVINGKEYYWNYAFDMWDYDNDTALGIDNNGVLNMTYGHEDSDYLIDGDPTYGWLFNAGGSTFWCRIRDLMEEEITYLTTSSLKNFFNKNYLIELFDNFQSQFPEELWRADVQRKYIRTYERNDDTEYGSTTRFLTEMMNGRKKYQRRQFIRDQIDYIQSKYNIGSFLDEKIDFRCTSVSSNNLSNYDLSITPYSDMYVTVQYGTGGLRVKKKAKAGEVVIINAPSGFENASNTQILIYGAKKIQSINDLSLFYMAQGDFSSAERLRKLVIANKDIEGYSNEALNDVTFGSNKLLEYLDLTNCTNLSSPLNFEANGCTRLSEFYANNTNINSIEFANNGNLKIAYLPSSLSTLVMQNLNLLTYDEIHFDGNSLNSLTLNGLSNEISYNFISNVIDSLTILESKGINWNVSDLNIIDKIYNIESNLSGKLTLLNGCNYSDRKIAQFVEKWPNLQIDTTKGQPITEHKVTFIYYNGEHQEEKIYYVLNDNSINKEFGGLPFELPAREKDSMNTYEVDTVSLNAFLDSKITKATIFEIPYKATIRKFTVNWRKIKDGGILYSLENVEYGSEALYNEDIEVTRDGNGEAGRYYLFNGWSESTGRVTKDMDVYAKWLSADTSVQPTSTQRFNDYSLAEINALIEGKKNLKDYFFSGDIASFYLGNDYEFENIDSEVIIPIDNPITTGIERDDIKLFDMPYFTLALDFKYGSSNSILSCFENVVNGNIKTTYGMELCSNSSDNLIKVKFNGSTIQEICPSKNRDIIVIRKNNDNIYIYRSNSDAKLHQVNSEKEFQYFSYEVPGPIVISISSMPDEIKKQIKFLINANNKIYWCKLWNDDLGNDICKKIVSDCREYVSFRYDIIQDDEEKQGLHGGTSISFILNGLLGYRSIYYDKYATNWVYSDIFTMCTHRLYDMLPIAVQSLIKKRDVVTINQKTKEKETICTKIAIPSYINIIGVTDSTEHIEEDFTYSFFPLGIAYKRLKIMGYYNILPEEYREIKPTNENKYKYLWYNNSLFYVYLDNDTINNLSLYAIEQDSDGGWVLPYNYLTRSTRYYSTSNSVSPLTIKASGQGSSSVFAVGICPSFDF